MTADLVITPYERRYRQPVNDLLFRSYRVHTHFDWHDTNEWLDLPGMTIRLAWQEHLLVGVLGISEVLNAACWVRLLGVRDHSDPALVLPLLWHAAQPALEALGARALSLLVIRDWVLRYIPDIGFRYDEEIVTLRRHSNLLPLLPTPRAAIRVAREHDLVAMTGIDHAAFAPPWQLSAAEIQQARRIASSATIADLDGRVIGYQVSTAYRGAAHLARLAIAPDMQGRQIGAALLDDMIRYFLRRDILTITVNTQAANFYSQRLYERYGFTRNGYDLPVWTMSVV